MNDTDADDGDGPASLTALVHDDPDHGTLTLGVDGSFDYVPDPDFFGVDAFPTLHQLEPINLSQSAWI